MSACRTDATGRRKTGVTWSATLPPPRTMAKNFPVARHLRHHRQSEKHGRCPQAMDQRAWSVRSPAHRTDIEGHSRRVWRTEADDDAIEAIAISGMGHGVPLATGGGPERCGNAGSFHFNVGLSSSHHIVRFLGARRRDLPALEPRAVPQAPPHLAPIVVQSAGTALIAAREHRVCRCEVRTPGRCQRELCISAKGCRPRSQGHHRGGVESGRIRRGQGNLPAVAEITILSIPMG